MHAHGKYAVFHVVTLYIGGVKSPYDAHGCEVVDCVCISFFFGEAVVKVLVLMVFNEYAIKMGSTCGHYVRDLPSVHSRYASTMIPTYKQYAAIMQRICHECGAIMRYWLQWGASCQHRSSCHIFHSNPNLLFCCLYCSIASFPGRRVRETFLLVILHKLDFRAWSRMVFVARSRSPRMVTHGRGLPEQLRAHYFGLGSLCGCVAGPGALQVGAPQLAATDTLLGRRPCKWEPLSSC